MDGSKIVTIPNLSSWLILGWGVFCANPYSDLFDKNPHLFAPMVLLLNSEVVWGISFGSLGLLGLILSYYGHADKTASLMFAVFMALTALYFIGDVSQPGWYFFGSIGLVNLFIQGVSKWKSTQ